MFVISHNDVSPELGLSADDLSVDTVVRQFTENATRRTIEVLDRAIPLDGASHALVANYSTEIPTRYAKFVATLTDGKKIGLRDARQFIGWTGRSVARSFLFRDAGGCVEIRTDPGHPVGRHTPGNVFKTIIDSIITTGQCRNDSDAANDVSALEAATDNWPGQMLRNVTIVLAENNPRKAKRTTELCKFIGLDGMQILLTRT